MPYLNNDEDILSHLFVVKVPPHQETTVIRRFVNTVSILSKVNLAHFENATNTKKREKMLVPCYLAGLRERRKKNHPYHYHLGENAKATLCSPLIKDYKLSKVEFL